MSASSTCMSRTITPPSCATASKTRWTPKSSAPASSRKRTASSSRASTAAGAAARTNAYHGRAAVCISQAEHLEHFPEDRVRFSQEIATKQNTLEHFPLLSNRKNALAHRREAIVERDAVDRTHHARQRARIGGCAAELAADLFVVLGERDHRRFRPHLHDPVIVRFQLREQLRQRERGCVLEVMHEDDAFAVL